MEYTMVPRNPFQIARRHIDFRMFEDVICERINNFVGSFKTHFDWLNPQKINKLFWDVADGKFNPDPHNLYVKIVFLAGRFIMFDLLLEEKKINQLEFEILHQWYKYLCKRTIPHVHKISDNFFGSLISNIPIINVDSMVSLFEKAIKLFSQTQNLKDILLDEHIDPVEKILKFEQNYMKLYPAFLHKCELFGLKLGKHEGGKKYKNNMWNIFSLSVRNADGKVIQKGGTHKPPDLIDYTLNSLIHIRNAIGHPDRGGIRRISNEIIKIIDCNDSGEITYEKEYNFPGLWQVIYILTILEIGFEMMALFFDIFNHAMFIDKKYNVLFICDCKHIDKHFVPPPINFIICKKCGKLHPTNNLRVWII